MKVNHYLFHVPTLPRTRRVINYDALEKLSQTRKAPTEVHVIDTDTSKRLGLCSTTLALVKYR